MRYSLTTLTSQNITPQIYLLHSLDSYIYIPVPKSHGLYRRGIINRFVYNWNHILNTLVDTTDVTKGRMQFLESYSSFSLQKKKKKTTNKGELISELPGDRDWVRQKTEQEFLNDWMKMSWSQALKRGESRLKK